METGILNIVATKSKKKIAFFSKAIMWWTKQKFSHVARVVSVRDWGKSYYQASEGNVNYEHESEFNKKHEIVESYSIEIPKEIEDKIKKACYQEAGRKYGTMQNLGIFITDIYYKIFKKEMENPWTKGRICSEVLYVNCFKILIPNLNYRVNKIKPHQIIEIIKNHFDQGEDNTWRLKV